MVEAIVVDEIPDTVAVVGRATDAGVVPSSQDDSRFKAVEAQLEFLKLTLQTESAERQRAEREREAERALTTELLAELREQ